MAAEGPEGRRIGAPVDLTYRVEELGQDLRVLEAIADGSHPFHQVLRDAQRPMLILGMGAIARPDGAAVMAAALKVAGATGMIGPEGADGWCGFNVLHTAAGRVGALDLGFVPGEGGRDVAGILDGASKGEVEFVWLHGADEIEASKLGDAFVVYLGSHGDAGAHRADVILPAAAYTEKNATYVSLEGRAQQALRCVFPPGEAREDWTILRALSGVIGKPLPYDSLEALRAAMAKDNPVFARLDEAAASPGADPALWAKVGEPGGILAVPPVYPIADFYLTNPIARASRTMAECSRTYVDGPKAEAAE